MILLLVLLGAVLIRLLAEQFYKKNWQKQLTVLLQFQETPLYEGEEGYLTETIENRKWLVLPMLQVAFGVSRNLNFSTEENTSVSDQSYKRDIFSVMGYQRIIRQVPFTAVKRGYYEIQKTELLTRGILLSGIHYATLSAHTCLYVYPKQIAGAKWKQLLRKLMGTAAVKKQRLEDPFSFRGIREYTIQDPMQKINWKASAKTGELMVNLWASASSGRVYLLLDVEDETIWKYEEIHEEGIRLAAAAAVSFLGLGMEVGLLTNGRDCLTGREIFLPASAGSGHKTKLAQNLARIDLSMQPRKFSACLEEKQELLSSKENLCILITKNQYQRLVEAMRTLADSNQSCIYLATLYEEMEWRLQTHKGMEVLRWEVKK